MAFELQPGEICSVQRQFLFDGKLAFKMGDEVQIDAISADPQRPGFKYLVLSKALNKRIRLRGVDLERVYCPMCGFKLDPTADRCDRCDWLYPGHEQVELREDFENFQEAQREARNRAIRDW